MASPHVAGVVALMAQKNPALTAGQAESILEGTAMPIDHRSAEIVDSNTGSLVTITWGSDAVGSGLVQADRALGLNTAGSVKGKK
jgi:subtilisin family serine protease